MNLKTWLLVACTFTCMGALAQDLGDTRVLKGRDVTEADLLNALTPPEEGVRTRTLVLGTQKKPGAAAPRRQPSASLLITFETNSSVLSSSAREQLDVVGAALRNDRLKSYSFQVEGHADPRGRPDDNMQLSRQRAESVRQYLVETHHIEAERLLAVGKGDLEPLIRSVPAAPENRRVTIVTQVKTE